MRLSFLSKLIVFGVLLGTLPVIFIGAFAYVTSSNEIERRVNEGKMQLLHQTSANVEQILTTVNHTLNQATNSTVLRRSLDSPLSASDFKAYNDLSMELRHMQSFDTRVEDVVLINTRHNWMIKNSGLYRFDDYEHADALEALLQAGEDTVWTLTPTAWFYSEESANHIACPYTISLVKRLPAASLEKFALAIANIPTCALSELLAHGQEAGAALMILDERRRVLLHTNPDRIGLPVEETGLLDLERMERATAPFAATIGSERYSVGLHRSDFNGWTYVSAVSVDDLMQESRKIGLYTVYICLSMLALSALLAWFGSRRMYSPIRALLGQMKDRLPVDAGPAPGNEFQAIGEQLQRLFQSNSRLEKELGLHLQQARTFALMKAFQGQLKPNDIEGKLDASGFGSQLRRWRSMAVVTLQIDALDPARFGRNDLELVLFAVQNIAEELIDADARLQPIVIDHTLVTLIGSEEADLERFAAQAYEWTEKLQRSIRHYLSLQVSAGISLPFQGVDRLTAAYREGLEALKHRLKLGEGVIIPYENLNAGKHFLLLNYPNQSENDLFDAIKLADAPKARELLKQLLHTILAAELAPQDYQIPLARLLNNLVIAAQESGIGLSQLHSSNESLYEELFRLQIAGDVEEWFWRKLAEPMIRIFRDRQNEQYHNVSEKIIDLIQRRYDTDLTLEECAELLHYNANYLSGVFRKETNCSFTEYLTMYRFKMAKRWLAETDMPIKDVSARLRYNNPQNFIRSFRKQEGMTPGQYRSAYAKRPLPEADRG